MPISEPDENVLVPPSHPTLNQIMLAPRRHYLFGFPITRSASPAFHNLILQSLPSISSITTPSNYPTYSLSETQTIFDTNFYHLVRCDPLFAGASVTMPLKVAVTAQLGQEHILDELSASGEATQTVNTIVVLPQNIYSKGKRRMHGTNTDYLGITHAILRSVAIRNGEPRPSVYIDPRSQRGDHMLKDAGISTSYRFPRNPEGKTYSAFIIGSGGTCRSAVWALHKLGLGPLYLLNRDKSETDAVINHFGDSIDLRAIRTDEEYDHQSVLRQSGQVGHIVAAVGAIPAFQPRTGDEKMVYNLAHRFFAEPYFAFSEAHSSPVDSPFPASHSSVLALPLPGQRPFLEMCYVPRLTPLLMGAQAKGWDAIGGVEAMIEQGLAQARMWAASAKILAENAEGDPTEFAIKAGDDGPLGAEIEDRARRLVTGMMEIDPPVVTTVATAVSAAAAAAASVQRSEGQQASQAYPVH